MLLWIQVQVHTLTFLPVGGGGGAGEQIIDVCESYKTNSYACLVLQSLKCDHATGVQFVCKLTLRNKTLARKKKTLSARAWVCWC